MVAKSFVTISDIHYPYQDAAALKLVTMFLKDFHPHELYFNGDIYDMPQISKYSMRRAELLKTTSVQEHLDIGNEGVARLVDAAGARKNRFTLGNHEDRWEMYLGSEAKALASLRCLEFDKVFQLDKMEWKKYGDGFWLNDRLFLYHGTFINVNWTDTERQRIGASTITGHMHKQRVTYHTDRSKTYKSIGQGCLCKLDPPYLRIPPNWQQGFAYGYLMDSEKFITKEVEIIEGDGYKWMMPEGKLYRVKL
jgi:UDP-2,3-diacylglucosamine pyrophosphatase LpxH